MFVFLSALVMKIMHLTGRYFDTFELRCSLQIAEMAAQSGHSCDSRFLMLCCIVEFHYFDIDTCLITTIAQTNDIDVFEERKSTYLHSCSLFTLDTSISTRPLLNYIYSNSQFLIEAILILTSSSNDQFISAITAATQIYRYLDIQTGRGNIPILFTAISILYLPSSASVSTVCLSGEKLVDITFH